MTLDQVRSVEIGTGADRVRVHYAAFSYPTELAARNAWERASRKSKLGQAVSVYRLTDPSTRQPVVVALSEDERDVAKMGRVIAQAGITHPLDDGTIWNLTMRRGRVASASGSVGDSKQQARYGTGGAQLDQLGQMSPRKRPQG